MGFKENEMQEHLWVLQGVFLRHSDDFGRLWSITQPGAVQGHVTSAAGTGSEGPNTQAIQRSLPRAAEHLKLCLPSLNMLLEERNHPASVITPTTKTSQALWSFQWTARYCSSISHFPLFSPHNKTAQTCTSAFLPVTTMTISWVPPKKKKKRDRIERGGLSGFLNQLFHLGWGRRQAQKWSALHDGCSAVNDTLLEVSTQFSVNKWLYKNSHYLRRPFSFQDKRTSGWKLQN